MKWVSNRLNLRTGIQYLHRAFLCWFHRDLSWTFGSLFPALTINCKLGKGRYIRVRCIWRWDLQNTRDRWLIYLEVRMGWKERPWHQTNAIPWQNQLSLAVLCLTLLKIGNGSWVQAWANRSLYLCNCTKLDSVYVCFCLCLKRIPCPRWENLHSLEHHCARRCGCFHVSLEVNHWEPATGQGMVSGRLMV